MTKTNPDRGYPREAFDRVFAHIKDNNNRFRGLPAHAGHKGWIAWVWWEYDWLRAKDTATVSRKETP